MSAARQGCFLLLFDVRRWSPSSVIARLSQNASGPLLSGDTLKRIEAIRPVKWLACWGAWLFDGIRVLGGVPIEIICEPATLVSAYMLDVHFTALERVDIDRTPTPQTASGQVRMTMGRCSTHGFPPIVDLDFARRDHALPERPGSALSSRTDFKPEHRLSPTQPGQPGGARPPSARMFSDGMLSIRARNRLF